ncbi:MAG TPA: hypothetical protein VJW23_01760 [Propionibacteriaceae bacterium]|nr:hypothetical protein [Propionibacteriaceae bacterium]
MADIEFDEITDEQGQELPQKIELSPDAIINQLMRRYSGQLQQQTWENTLLAAENEQLKTMLTEAKSEAAEDKATIEELSQMLDELGNSRKHWRAQAYRAVAGQISAEDLSPTDDPQPVDGFLAMAAGQPGLASAPAPAEQ